MSPRIRQTVYYAGTVASGILGIALLFNGVSADAAGSINSMIAGLVALLGGSAPAAVAAHTVAKQRANGAFDTQTPVDQAIAGIQATVAQAQNAAADVDRIKQAASDVLGQLPVLGPLAQQVINAVKVP